jgi:phage shock protein PspC (stress-responsive transcriptional regulator)/VIT1/CCC1 family predicted Fe2+/Mn2+ transporter
MNKTIIININGTVFHIEEDAYEILKNYMTDVKRHFLNSADSHEITTDIENRIAEMFSEILAAENKQVIIEQDVKKVVEQMGSVQDFESAEAEEAGSNAHNHTYTSNTGARALFRDPDDHLLGGVCAGLANYFDIQAVWVRLLFAVAVAFFGSGILLYAILWIVIPRAITRADRMAMKGEKLNLQGFKNNFEEELSSVRDHLSNLHSEAQPLIYKLRDFASEFFHHLGLFLRGTGKVLVKVLGILILLACLGFSIFMLVCLCLVTIWADTHMHMFPFSIMSSEYANRVFVASFVAAFIPVLAIFLITLKGIFNARSVDRSVASVIFVIWLFAVGVLTFYGTQIAGEFKSSATFKQTINIATPSKGIYYLKLNDVKYFTHEDSVRLNMKADFQNMVVTNENNNTYEEFEMNNISIKIEKSDVGQPVLVETFHAKGREYEDALINARKTKYIFTQKDSVLTFDRYLQRLPDVGWHDQQIELTLKVPLNTVVIIDDRLNDVLRDGIDVNECKDKNKLHDATSAPFIMTANGLECKVDTLVTVKPDSTKILKVK